jgi:hypothetical protein
MVARKETFARFQFQQNGGDRIVCWMIFADVIAGSLPVPMFRLRKSTCDWLKFMLFCRVIVEAMIHL